jgi:hypothetical protein
MSTPRALALSFSSLLIVSGLADGESVVVEPCTLPRVDVSDWVVLFVALSEPGDAIPPVLDEEESSVLCEPAGLVCAQAGPSAARDAAAIATVLRNLGVMQALLIAWCSVNARQCTADARQFDCAPGTPQAHCKQRSGPTF